MGQFPCHHGSLRLLRSAGDGPEAGCEVGPCCLWPTPPISTWQMPQRSFFGPWENDIMGGKVASQPIGIRKTIGKPSINGISTSVYPEWLIVLDSSGKLSSLPRQFEKRSIPKRGKHWKHCPAELLVVKCCKGHEDCQFCRAWQGQTPTPWHQWWVDLSGDGFFRGDCTWLTWGTIQKYLQHIPLVGDLEHVLFSISYMGCHPNPIDELIFSEGWLNHQPVQVE